MVGRVTLVLILVASLAGCGERAAKEDMIDAPSVATGTADSAKARGLSAEEIARQDAMSRGMAGGNPR